MRIAIVCTYYPYPPSAGGVETIVRQTAEELAKRGHEVHIVSSTYDVTTQKPVTRPGIEEKNNVVVHKLKSKPIGIGYARILIGLRNEIAKIRPDIVHVHNLHPSLFQLAKWKVSLGYKLVAELHYPAVAEKLSARLTLPFVMFALNRYYWQVDAFITHTTLEAKWLMKWSISLEKIVVIPLFALPDWIYIYAERNLGKFMKGVDRIIFVGRIAKVKGLDVLFRAIAKLKSKFSFDLLLVGPVDDRYYTKLKRLAAKLNIDKYIKFLGPRHGIEKYKLIAESKVLALPSYREYTPVVLLEAQALGTPVVASKVGAVSEIVKDGETGILVEPGDVDGLTKALETLLMDEKLWKSMSLKAREWARRFTLSKVMDKLEKLYNNIQKTTKP